MLWAYFDDCGLHKAGTDKLDWLVLGGGMAPAENGEQVLAEWEASLNDFGITIFHMECIFPQDERVSFVFARHRKLVSQSS
jgi:hypothetical protein